MVALKDHVFSDSTAWLINVLENHENIRNCSGYIQKIQEMLRSCIKHQDTEGNGMKLLGNIKKWQRIIMKC